MRRPHLDAMGLPDHRTRAAPNYLYAIEFTDLTVKVGVTWNPRARASTIERALNKVTVRAIAVPFHGRWRQFAERDALRRLARIGSPRRECSELFVGVQFHEAANVLKQVARREFTPRRIEAAA